MHKPLSSSPKGNGFTIVELLIIVVVIAILAAITVVSYNGLQSRARDTQLKADLKNAATQLALYDTENGVFPPTQASAVGVKDSNDTKFTYTYNPGDNTYCLIGTNNGVSYAVSTNQQTPGQYICLSTLAGSPDGLSGYADGVGVGALFQKPGFLVLGADNFLYVKDGTGSPYYIRKINPTTASVSTVASTNASVQGMAVTSNGTIYATSVYPMCIKKIVSGIISDVICSGFEYPWGIAVGPDGNLYVTDPNNNEIKKINPTTGVMTAFVGSSTPGYVNASGTAARFDIPAGIVAGSDGNLYVADAGNNRIRKVTLAGNVTTVTGTGGSGHVDGTATQAQIYAPNWISADSSNTLYVMDGDGRVRKVTSGGVVTTLADGKIFSNGSGISISPFSTGTVYVNSFTDHAIYKLQ